MSRKPRDLEIGETVPFFPMSAVPEGGFRLDSPQLRRPGEVRSGVFVQEGDVLLAKITPCLENGKLALARGLPSGWAYATTEVYPIHADAEHLDADFLAFFLAMTDVRNELAGRMTGTTGRRRLPKQVLETLPLPLPPLPEQQAIARVLRTVQQAKETTEAVLEAARELRRSIMHHLFTYGPVPVDRIGEFELQESVSGTMRGDWSAVPVGALIAEGIGGDWGSADKQDGYEHTVVIRGTDFEAARHGDLSAAPRRWIKATSRVKRALHEGDVLVELSGGSADQPTGRCLLADTRVLGAAESMIFTNFVRRLRLVASVVPEFFEQYWHYLYEHGRTREYERKTTNIRNFKLTEFLEKESAPELSGSDQSEILTSLAAVNRKIESEQSRLDALAALFDSLLRDLMTARVRVPAGIGAD